MRFALIALLLACSHAQKPIHVDKDPNLTPALDPLAWWLGDWKAESGDTGVEHWVAADGALYGVSLHDDGSFEVMIVDDGQGAGPADGVLRFVTMPNSGARMIELTHHETRGWSIGFVGETNITYLRDGEHLVAQVGDKSFTFKRTNSERAQALEDADIAFAKDTAARGIEGWVAAFDAKGAMMRKTGRIEGADAIRAAMAPTLEKTKISWAPIASRQHGDIGFTIGKATFTGTAGSPANDNFRSTYVTIWKKQTDGSWKALFDTGRAVNGSAPTAPAP